MRRSRVEILRSTSFDSSVLLSRLFSLMPRLHSIQVWSRAFFCFIAVNESRSIEAMIALRKPTTCTQTDYLLAAINVAPKDIALPARSSVLNSLATTLTLIATPSTPGPIRSQLELDADDAVIHLGSVSPQNLGPKPRCEGRGVKTRLSWRPTELLEPGPYVGELKAQSSSIQPSKNGSSLF